MLLSAVLVGVGGRTADAHTPHDSIDDVVVSPNYAEDGSVFVIAANRLMVSTDSPYRWQPLVRGLPRAPEDGKSLDRIAISPSDPDVMYVSSRVGSVFRSDDGGASWQPASGGLAGAQMSAIAVAPDDPDVVLAAGAINRFYRTIDGGRQWSPVPGFARVPTITFVPRSGRAVVGDNQGRVSVSDDDGATWKVASQTPGSAITATAASDGTAATVFAGSSRGVLLRSDDGGDTFTAVGTGLPAERTKSIALSADYDQDGTLWTSMASKGVFRSTDGGKTWKRTSKGLTTDIQAGVVGVDLFRNLAIGTKANGKRTLYAGTFDGLSRSVDDAATWTPVETLVDYIAGLAVSPDFADDKTVAVASYVKGAYLSTDGGRRWKLSDRGLEHVISAGNKFAPVKRLHNIVFSPEYAKDDTIFSASWTAFLKSTDRGRSWTTEYVTLPTDPAAAAELRQFVIAVSPDYAADRTIFLGSRQGDVFRSKEAGVTKSWELIGNAGSRIRSIVVDPGDPQSLFAGTEQGVMRSDDGGATWIRTGPDGLAMLAISPAYETDGTLFAGTESGLYVTRDRGATWMELAAAPLSDSSLVEALAVSPDYGDDGTVLVSVSGDGLYRSTDAGASFVEVGTDLTEGNRVIADFTNPTSQPIQFSPAFAEDRTVFAYSGPFVVRSTDAGDSWDVLRIPTAAAYVRGADPALFDVPDGGGHHGSVGTGDEDARRRSRPQHVHRGRCRRTGRAGGRPRWRGPLRSQPPTALPREGTEVTRVTDR